MYRNSPYRVTTWVQTFYSQTKSHQAERQASGRLRRQERKLGALKSSLDGQPSSWPRPFFPGLWTFPGKTNKWILTTDRPVADQTSGPTQFGWTNEFNRGMADLQAGTPLKKPALPKTINGTDLKETE